MTLEVDYPPAEAARWDDPGCLGVVGFGAHRPGGLPAHTPFLGLPLPALGAGPPRFEVWRATSPAARCDADGFVLAVAGAWLLGSTRIDLAAAGDLAALVRDTYTRLFAAAAQAGRPHLLRVFHYLPRITAHAHGAQRYHAFNTGRAAAFATAGRAVAAAPAACALGLGDDGPDALWLYFLAGAEPGVPVENARQVSAWRYPPAHGPDSPVFSRATMLGGRTLLVSGTASIVGHQSRHPGDVGAQTDEIVRNLAALAAAAPGRRADRWRLKVYCRRAEDHAAIAARLAAAGLDLAAEPLFLRADVCRDELLVEVEAVARLTPA